jgi:Uma2 family endonuclease
MATMTTALIGEAEYRELALMGENRRLELFRGHLREKPPVSVEHGHVIMSLARLLFRQLDPAQFWVSVGQTRLRVSSDTYYIPDIVVAPAALERALRATPHVLDAYPQPMPLVVEVWSPSTGGYDLNVKLADYQRRGDLEIWYLHPYQRFLRTWRRQPDGAYAESIFQSGTVRAESLPDFEFDVEVLFAP